jgi:hypothetical protein
MRFTYDTTDTGVRERHFSLGDIDGVLWTRAADSTGDPLVLLGHGGSQHKKAGRDGPGPPLRGVLRFRGGGD